MKNYINIYYDKIKSNEIIVCEKLRKSLENIINDDNPKYHFDIELANKPITFIEKFCKHSKGKWAGKPVILELWEKVLIQIIFGYVDKNNLRRYREVLVVVARKNGKSTLLSAIGLYMLFGDKEGGAQVCCVASKKDQAKIVFSEAQNMVRQSRVLSKHIRKRKSDLYFDLTMSTFEPLASDSNTLDGLNMSCGIIDELHSLKDRNIYDVSKQSMSTRTQPLLFMITTAGFVREGIYDDRYEYATKVINKQIVDEHFLSLIYELDNKKEWLDEKMWVKANPSLNTVKSLEYLRSQVNQAKNNPNYLPTVLTKDFDIRETGACGWLTFDQLNNEETYNIDDISDSYGIGGVDLSTVGDLTCASVLVRKHNKLYLLQKYFIPSERADLHIREDKVPYNVWNSKDYVRFCNGTKVNYTDITSWFIELKDKYKIYVLWVGYDKWQANYWCDEMKNNGFQMEEVIQGAKTMSAPMKLLATEMESKKINYGNNPVTKWNLSNTQIEVDKNENIRPVKNNSKQRIDGTVSFIDAYVVYQRHYEEFNNLTQEE